MFPRNSSSESESDASDSSDDSRRSFRVSVCLRRYFTDVRARAFVLVRARRRVRWLHRRVRRAFALRGAFCLRAAGHLLPRAEPLRVLRDGECVEVIPLHEAQAENRFRRDAVAQTEAEPRPEGTAIATRAFSVDATDCSGTVPNGDAANSDHCERRGSSTEPATALPAADRSALDTGAGGDGELLGLKRRALALLDAHCAPGGDGEPPPRRARRRVRRRARRAASPSAPPRSPAASPSAPPRSPAASPSAPPRSPAASPSAPPRSPAAPPAAPTTPRDVARNEDACARKPRMVHSLDLENIH